MKDRLHIFLTAIIIVFLFLAGCWDQRLLRDHGLILSVGYDRADKGDLNTTITYPVDIQGGSSGNNQSAAVPQDSKVVTVRGNTAKDAEKHLDQIIPEKFDRSKARVIFFGKEIAEEGIFSTLDSVYRDLRGALYAKVAIFEGEAKDALSVNSGQSILISDLYAQLLDSAEKSGITKNENVQEICPIILSKGQDVVLPYIGLRDGTKEPIIKGLALFADDKMTGSLNIDETTVLLILMDKITKDLSFNIKVSDEHKDPNKNFIDIALRKVKRKLKLETVNGRINVKIDVKAQVEIDEFAADNLSHSKKMKKLSVTMEKRLNEIAKKTIEQIQEANNDALGIGDKLRGYHHDTWKRTNWKKEYPDIPIEVNFKVEIIRHGIIN